MVNVTDSPAPAHATVPTRRLTPARRVLLLLGLPIVLAVLGYAAFSVVALLGSTTTTASSTLAPAGSQMRVHSGSGDITVRLSADGRVHVDTRLHYGLRRPVLRQRATSSGLELQASCLAFDPQCDVRYTLSVPAATDLVVSTGSGTLTVSGVRGAVTATTGSGDVRLRDTGGALLLRTGSGAITANGVHGDRVQARAGSGNVTVTSVVAPNDVRAETGSGDVRLTLPAGVSYAADVRTGSGSRRVDVATDPASLRRISVRTGSGDAVVRSGPPVGP